MRLLKRITSIFDVGYRDESDVDTRCLQLFRLLHWITPICIVGLFVTGLSLHAAAQPLVPSLGWSLFSNKLPLWLLSGRMHFYHLLFATIFLPSLVAMLWAYIRHEQPRRQTHIILFGGGLLMIITGLIMLHPFGPSITHTCARIAHTIVGLIILPITLICHAAVGLNDGRGDLGRTFNVWRYTKWRPLVGYALLLAISSCLVLNGLPIHRPWNTLTATRLPEPVEPDADLATLPWDTAKRLTVHLAGGAAFDCGQTDVSLKAFHDGRELFISAEWNDPREDRQYMPWVRTEDGWERQITDPNDESVYYEDKFALAFPIALDKQFDRLGCTAYCHIGGGRAYGYKCADSTIDVWHWKATRTDPVGQTDDKYWAAADFSAKDVGRHGDPSDGGGYKKNVAPGGLFPLFLPDGPAAIVDGIIRGPLARKYTLTAADKIKPGDVVPGIVASAFQGDRGHISCKSYHKDGRWQLYMRRKLDTKSPFDAAFILGKKHPFGCAAFDRSSKRHAYNFNVYELVLEK